MLTKVTDFRWTRSQRVFKWANSVTSLRVASLLSKAVKGELAAYLLYPRVLARRLVLRALLLPSPVRSTVQNKAVWIPEPSPGGMQGSLALHGTGVRSPPPSNLTLPRSPYEFELRSPGAKRCGYTF
ncbi:hypothetical protein VNO80_33825 [Phaseolus coccineus]|uniref:Uncharacterized protein n=1 Tax=Phaseolus coccineus TaxID=3886 RepID=A0AAN9L2B2_PHACN